MFTKSILYQRVNSVVPLEKEVFEEDLVCAVGELCAMFGERYVLDEESDLKTKKEYFTALLFLTTSAHESASPITVLIAATAAA